MELRRTLIQAAWAAMCRVRTSHPMIDWARRLAERRGRPVAAVALARKLAGILFAMWRLPNGSTDLVNELSLERNLPKYILRNRELRILS